MTLRTPRRRISPRTRKRYRAIKDFFKRAIGSSSQPDIEINSSIAVNVTDLNRKIVGLEQQLSEVSRTCREFIYLDASRRESQSLLSTQLKDDIRRDDSTARVPQGVETKILYKTSESHYKKSEGSDYTPKHSKEINDGYQNHKMNLDRNYTERKKKKSKVDTSQDMNQNFRRHRTKSISENIVSSYSTTDFHSLTELKTRRHLSPGYSGDHVDRRAHKKEKNVHSPRREEFHNEQFKKAIHRNSEQHCEDRAVKHSRNRKSNRGPNELDQDFIADIIKRQYKPMKMFGRRQSDLSQFTEPMCRDREFALTENLQEDTELCSCCYGGRHSPKPYSNARSVCDARLYSSKKKPLIKYRRVHANAYNDAELYDLIPVKEKSSPKTRRKFYQDNFANHHYYKEVPPSPKTHRPRLNLKAQYYTETDDHMDYVRYAHRRVSPKRHHKYQEPTETFDSEHSSQILHTMKNKQPLISKKEQIHQEMGTMSSLQYPQHFDVELNTTTTALNKTQETVSSSDKTDRALCEIKDILQTFLQEIKKEASSSEKSDVSTKITENCAINTSPQGNASMMPNSGHSFNNYSAPQCSTAPTPYLPPYPNACCYPILPIYPMNCMQNSYVMPNQSFSCCCADKAEATSNSKIQTNNNETYNNTTNETDELIKEIYKFVAQSPTFSRKHDDIAEHQTRKFFENKVLTSRSAGGSNHVSKHDAKIGTTQMKCYSKSCEAIGSRIVSDAYYSGTNATYSDTILENLSLEATATTSSETDLSTEREKNKSKRAKLSKVLQSFRLFKKKKNKETIEELSESESTIDVEIKKKSPFRKPPFPQEVTNYMMYGQEYDRPPQILRDYPNHYLQDYRPPYNPATQIYPPFPPPNDPYYESRMRQSHNRSPPPHPSAPPYANPYDYNQMQPQVPLCLKEIEVKSMATQSERKMSFFRKIKQKIQPDEQIRNDGARTYATQTKQDKPSLWKSLQTKAMEGKNDSMAYSYKQQQKLSAGDTKMRNAMLKKMFTKRNPFSPRNLIVRTLLGKDKSSFGDPPAMYRPRMFI